MLLREPTPIGPDETAGELSARLAGIGARLLLRTLEEIDTLPRIPQDAAQATLAPRLKKEDGWLRPTEPARDLVNRDPRLQPVAGRRLAHAGGPPPDLARPGLPDHATAPPGTLIPLSPPGRGQGEGAKGEGAKGEGPEGEGPASSASSASQPAPASSSRSRCSRTTARPCPGPTSSAARASSRAPA